MMASLYATPPPDTSDLNGEDTSVLSDTSNSSQTNSSINSQHHHKAPKRSILVSSPSTASSNNCALLGSLFDPSPDLSKKRRKQTTPIRISATAFELQQQQQQHQNNGSVDTNGLTVDSEVTEIPDDDDDEVRDEASASPSAVPSLETDGLQKIFLKNLSQLQASVAQNSDDKSRIISQASPSGKNHQQHSLSPLSAKDMKNHNGHVQKQHDFENDIEVEYHNKFLQAVNGCKSPNNDGQSSNPWGDKKPDDSWLSLASLPFPFPPEAAAAALSASGYLPQLPMLAPFGAADGVLSRGSAPLRIFNPEAYCDLCNKEFCNKYFLKTHKANKHGIYEPMTPMNNNDMPTLSQLSQMQQMGHALMQQQSMQQFGQQNAQQKPQLLVPTVNQDPPMPPQGPPAPNAFCDICFKKFSSPAALKKHRIKIHDIGGTKSQGDNKSSGDDQQSASNGDQERNHRNDAPASFNLPEGFREDYQVEQEDTNFTPEPRKLSPTSIQQAKDANFSYDKLKRLGVTNPEAFCELCCKEYCNKYFLRTHKLKRHGIFLPTEDMKDEGRALWPYMQTSPLNLIMGGDLKALQMYAKKKEELENGLKISSPAPSDYDDGKDDAHTIKDDDDDDKGKKSPQLTQQESDAISVDLQKLQSMILQLNELNQNRCVGCAICGKEMENQYMLHAHMLAEHSGFTNNNSIKLSPRPSSAPSPGDFEVCKQCDKEFSNIFLLKQHLLEHHGMAPLSPPLREGFVTPDRKPASVLSQPSTPTQADRKQMFQMTPTSSYCEICNKELCNKYFMKTHMQRMHGIEIENGAQIGGVVCNICNKELCSKYFLRVHKHNTHGIVEDGSPQQQRPSSESVDSDNGFQLDLKPGEVSDQSNRYFSHFTEVCPLCSRRFRSAKWLKAHLMSDHGKAGVDKLNEIETKIGPIKAPSPGLKIPNGNYGLSSPDLMIKTSLGGLFSGENSMATSPGSQGTLKGYQCSFCSFSTPILAILFIHERSHQAGNTAINLMQNPNKSESAVSLAKEFNNSQQPTPGVMSPSSTPASTPIPSNPQESNSGKTELVDSMPQLNTRPSIGLPQEAGPLVMQSFLLEELPFSKSLVNGKTGTNDNYKFIPSMVILPVRERISSPITVSFTLTPA